MPVVTDKYRSDPIYHVVYSELITAARYRGVVTYQEIAALMGLPMFGSHMGKEIGHLLGEISEDEVECGRPMLSAVAVGTSGEPGDGFYALALQLGKLSDDGPKARAKFWESERSAAYKIWKRRLPTGK